MTIRRRLLMAVLFGVELHALAAGKAPETLMTVRGKQIFADDFSGASISPAWAVHAGKFALKDGALTALPSGDDHGTLRHEIAARDAVVQFDFKLGAGGILHVSVNGVNGHGDHIVRVMLSPKGFDLRKDGSKTDASDQHKVLDRAVVDLADGRWHTMVVEISGQQVLARVGDKHVLGSDPKIERPKGSVGFPMGGDALVDKVTVWEAKPNLEWPSAKAKLQAGRSQKTQQ
jgi:hypothetical protein